MNQDELMSFHTGSSKERLNVSCPEWSPNGRSENEMTTQHGHGQKISMVTISSWPTYKTYTRQTGI